ncbi:MAG TPA: heptaprenyl diphosphate synthase component 1 [Bacillaceae bacterium]|nr:heptaprenyl diphosphate synthase component 1 [Paenibacillus bovis]HLU22638.1 heptaprenyl diphosphate synthase component 1 [Bacillaceae bacterium]
MVVNTLNQQVESIIVNINNIRNNHYLNKHIEPLDLDMDRILFLSWSLHDSSLSKEEIVDYVTATVLAHLAMETHEQVANPNVPMKKRQLAILAGDYYSGLYYSILADYSNIQLIRLLATAIKIINEHKISIYQFQNGKVESLIENMKNIESTLVNQFSENFHVDDTKKELMMEFLFFRKMVSELESIHFQNETIFIKKLKLACLQLDDNFPIENLSNDEKNIIINECTHYIYESKAKLEEMSKIIPNIPITIQTRLNEVIKQFTLLSSQ